MNVAFKNYMDGCKISTNVHKNCKWLLNTVYYCVKII